MSRYQHEKDFIGGGYVSATALDKLQRTFGVDITPRAKVPDPMAKLPMVATKNCPCDPCRFKAVCLDGCDNFNIWAKQCTWRNRRERADAKRIAERLEVNA